MQSEQFDRFIQAVEYQIVMRQRTFYAGGLIGLNFESCGDRYCCGIGILQEYRKAVRTFRVADQPRGD